METVTAQYRDPETGQFAFDERWARKCVCGHTLGVHVAGGFDCIVHDVGRDDPDGEDKTFEPCNCAKFRPSRRKEPRA